MSVPKKTSKELTPEKQMEQRIGATYNELDQKEHLMIQLGMIGMEVIIRGDYYGTKGWHDDNFERGEHNHIIGLCRDYLREVHGQNCKTVEVTGDKHFPHELVFVKNGPLRVVPEKHKKTCKEAARRRLEWILNEEDYKEGQERDKMIRDILSKRYLAPVGNKKENLEKIIELIVEESMFGFNFIMDRKKRNRTG